ncbi:MAG: hypothetical protein AAFP23_11625 [Pseudomonadota bacterium]
MSRLQEALGRLEQAVAAVEEACARAALEASATQPTRTEEGGLAEEERNALLARIEALEAQTKEDALLRVEAAEAVKDALAELRSVGGGGARG